MSLWPSVILIALCSMQQFVIPQFISEEPSIIGPIKVRQFIILLVASIIGFVIFRLSDLALFIVVGIPFIIFAIILAFYAPNGRPFHFFLLNLLQTLRRPSLRVWRKQVTTQEIRDELKEMSTVTVAPTVTPRSRPTSSHLAELALIVDTGGVYRESDKQK